MQWLGFGRGFVYNADDVANTFSEAARDARWAPEAKAASIAARRASNLASVSEDARKASEAAHAATPKGNLLGRVLLGERLAGTSTTHSLSTSAVDSANRAASTKSGTEAVDHHKLAATMHDKAANALRKKGNDELANAHAKAASLHIKAASIHSGKGNDFTLREGQNR